MPPNGEKMPAAWAVAVHTVAARIGRPEYPPGNLAQLRRLEPGQPEGSAYWRLVADHLPEAFDNCGLGWAFAATLRGMALAAPFHRLERGERRSMGQALAEMDVSDARLLRLLRADGDALPRELRRLARLVQAKGDKARFDWTEAMWLLWTAGRGGEGNRRKIAKEYYRVLFAPKKEAENAST
jgi:CRISPR type I-E-associated protein CasB/Cse2